MYDMLKTAYIESKKSDTNSKQLITKFEKDVKF